MNPCISIIIPVFNLGDTVINCIDSIYEAHIPIDDLEVICIDDASTDGITPGVLNQLSLSRKYTHLKIITHGVNKKMGGARNTGINNASGEYLLFIDGDDTFNATSLFKIYKHIKNQKNIDILMYDHKLSSSTSDNGHFTKNHSNIMSGRTFFLTEQISWTPWSYACRKEYLTKNNLYFIENHFFEDTDWAIKIVTLANLIQYVPIIAYIYTLSENQTSKIRNSIIKIQDFLLCNERLHHLSEEFKNSAPEVAKLILNHHIFHYNIFIIKLSWRISFHHRYKFILTHPPAAHSHKGFILCKLTKSHPLLTSLLLSAVAPFLHLASKTKKYIKQKKHRS